MKVGMVRATLIIAVTVILFTRHAGEILLFAHNRSPIVIVSTTMLSVLGLWFTLAITIGHGCEKRMALVRRSWSSCIVQSRKYMATCPSESQQANRRPSGLAVMRSDLETIAKGRNTLMTNYAL